MYGLTTVHTVPRIFSIDRFLMLKKLQTWEVWGFFDRTVRFGPGFKILVITNSDKTLVKQSQTTTFSDKTLSLLLWASGE